MVFIVREMDSGDRAVWAAMRAMLWPDETPEAHAIGIERTLQSAGAWAFIAETPSGAPVGFAELAIRKYANGCESQPVPFLEGICVSPSFRRQGRQGAAGGMIAHIEAFVTVRGFHEIGSDAPIDNSLSHAAHARWGFSETERVVYFRKDLNAPRT